jgi:choline dehydrogenase-like flavoprotein
MALAAGVRLITGARVAEIVTDAQGRASGALWIDRRGMRRVLRARIVVLAANGIGTPRLLLLSASGRHPDGLGNRTGLVGRRLMLHPLARVTGLFADDVDGWRGNAAGAIASHEFYETDRARGFARGVKLQIMRGTGPMLTALGAGGARLPWGRSHHARFAEVFGHTMSVSICSDDFPDPANRVTLDTERCDTDGLPGARMTYAVGANTRAALDFGIARGQDLMREAGAAEITDIGLLADAGFHLMGTAGMGADPERSVTDATGRVHDVPNLYVADGSAFTTAGAVNPTHTIQALALRQADLIAVARREIPDPL